MADRYMMATQAMHAVGDLSRAEPSLAIVYRETESDYVGEWATGVGFVNVRFPRETTRELTDEEKARFDGQWIECAGMIRPIRVAASRPALDNAPYLASGVEQ